MSKQRPKRRIGFDMDEVICDTYAALSAWAVETFGLRSDPGNPAPLHEMLTPAERAEMLEMLNEGSFFRHLAPMAGAVEVLRSLVQTDEVFIVTAAMEHPGSMAPKFAWIEEHLPFFDPLHIVFCGEKHIADVDYLVDDTPRHFARLRGEGIVFTAPRNLGETGYRRVDNWAQVASLFGA